MQAPLEPRSVRRAASKGLTPTPKNRRQRKLLNRALKAHNKRYAVGEVGKH